MTIYDEKATSQERQKIREAREKWLEYIQYAVERQGYLEITEPLDLDDPPYPVILEVALVLGGHRPAEQHTAMRELRKLAEKQDWILEFYQPSFTWWIRAKEKLWKCLTCNGWGRHREPLKAPGSLTPDQMMMQVERICTACHGYGTITSRTNPEFDVCWIEYDWNMPRWDESEQKQRMGSWVERGRKLI